MDLIEIDPLELEFKACAALQTGWALLTPGVPEDYNTMTIGWGMFGRMWSAPAVTVYARQSRYTNEYMQKYNRFSVCYFTEDYKRDLSYLGAKSGRNEDKVSHTSLTPFTIDGVVAFKEAYLTLICTKAATNKLTCDTINSDYVKNRWYPNDEELNYHTAYIGFVDKAFRNLGYNTSGIQR